VALFSSLLTRVRNYAGPRELPVGEDLESGWRRQISPVVLSQTRWALEDLEGAIVAADNGVLRSAGRLWRATRRDGVCVGVLSTRTLGLVQLPVTFASSDEGLISAISGEFRRVFPTGELALLAADGRGLGIGVAEFVELPGSRLVLRRLEPEFLTYRRSEDRWYYQSIRGLEAVNPGDGRWILHCPGGAAEPWSQGLWTALGRAFIAKEHAFYLRENYGSKLANAARIAEAPAGANDIQRKGWFSRVASWGVNTVFDVPPGYSVKLLESNGRGYDVFQQTIATSNQEIIVCLAGQEVTTTGGTGFANAGVHATIRSDLIQSDADALAETLNEQALPVWANERFGAGAVDDAPRVVWDTTPPKDLNLEALATNQAAIAIAAMNSVLAGSGLQVDAVAVARRFGVPLIETTPMPPLPTEGGSGV